MSLSMEQVKDCKKFCVTIVHADGVEAKFFRGVYAYWHALIEPNMQVDRAGVRHITVSAVVRQLGPFGKEPDWIECDSPPAGFPAS